MRFSYWLVRGNQNKTSELKHYGVLGMRWGVRKDDDPDEMEDYLRGFRKLNDMSVDEFISQDPSKPRWFLGSYIDPHAYSDPQMRQSEDDGFNQIGVENFFNVDAWNSASQREREAAHDYVTDLGCKLMNGLLRGTISDDDIFKEYGSDTVRAAHESIDMFTDMLGTVETKEPAFTARKTNSAGVAGLLGIDESDLSNSDVLTSLIGSRVQDPGFFSTTLVANADNIGGGYGDVKIFTHIPAGSQAMYLEPAATSSSYDRNCYEVTLNRGSIFNVSGINTDDKGRVEAIMLDLIGQEG